MKLAPYARPETFDPNTHRYGQVGHGYQIDTPATRCALSIAKDIYKYANQAGIAPLVLAQLITDAVNESIQLRNQCSDPLGEALLSYSQPSEESKPVAWRDAMKQLVFAARTSGGTAGSDSALVAACETCEAILSSHPPRTQPVSEPAKDNDWILAMAEALGSDSGFPVPVVPTTEAFRALFDAIRSDAIRQLKGQAAERVSVPRVPTEAMVDAGRKVMARQDPKSVSHARVIWVWNDMLAAAQEGKL